MTQFDTPKVGLLMCDTFMPLDNPTGIMGVCLGGHIIASGWVQNTEVQTETASYGRITTVSFQIVEHTPLEEPKKPTWANLTKRGDK